MYNFTLSLRASLLALVLTGFAALPSAAQSQVRADNYQDNRTFLTRNAGLAVDELLSTAATVDPGLIGGAALRVTFPTTVQTGQQGILVIKSSTSLATVLGGVSLRTFSTTAQDPDKPIQYVPLNDPALVQVTVAANDPTAQQIKFTATKAFNQLELDAGAVLNTSYSVNVYAVFATVAPLPVQLTTFQAKTTPAGVALRWETASEYNSDYFEVQRAEDVASSYSSLGQVKSAGTSTQTHAYQFVDAHATGLHYYRLRQVDFTVKESFSPVATVDTGLLASLEAYPTVATDVVHVAGLTGTQLHIFNEQGQRVQTAALATNQPQPLDVSGLPGGVYILRDAATGQSLRFIKSSGR